MKKLSLLLFSVLLSLSAHAQDKPAASPQQGGTLYLSASWQHIPFQELNGRLKTHNLPVAQPGSYSFGSGGYGIVGQVIIGGEGCVFRGRNETATHILSSSGGYGYFYLGWKPVIHDRLSLFPAIGAGSGGATVNVQEKHGLADFNQYLQQGSTGVRVVMGGFLLHSSIGGDYSFGENCSQFIGLRAGYNYSPKSQWSPGGLLGEVGEVQNAPSDRISSIFIQLRYGLKIIH